MFITDYTLFDTKHQEKNIKTESFFKKCQNYLGKYQWYGRKDQYGDGIDQAN